MNVIANLKFFARPLGTVLLIAALAGCGGAAEFASAPSVEEPRGKIREWAVENNAAAISTLRDGDLQINAGDENGWTPLHWAAVMGNVEAIDILLDRGANPDARAKDDETDLSAAAMKILIERDADNEHKFSEWKNEGDTVLGVAAVANRHESIAMLAGRGADVNARDAFGNTPLHNAAINNARLSAHELIARGASINARGVSEMTPLHVAAAGNAEQVATELIVRGANINARMEDSATPLHIVSALGETHDVMEVLTQRNANLEARIEGGETPLHVAVREKNYGAIRRLIEAGANIDAWTDEFYTSLHYAVNNNDLRLIEVLCDLGANVNAWDEDGDTPLHWAALNDFPESIRVLVHHCEVDINFENLRGETPLDLAVNEEKRAAINELQKHNAQRGLDS